LAENRAKMEAKSKPVAETKASDAKPQVQPVSGVPEK
jgi:hypothetical protein